MAASFVKAIHLHGDSILDNRSYVDSSNDECSVAEHLTDLVVPPTKVTLLATDGYVTTDATEVLNKMNAHSDDTLAVLSCGGNDALEFRASEDMQKHVYSILQGMEVLLPHLQKFEKDYERALWAITNTYKKENVRVCTIYNNVPVDGAEITESQLLALRLWNDVITEQANSYGVGVIDLRNICTESSDYSYMSPIEPSHQGGEKIAKAIVNSFSMKTVNCKPTSC